MSEPGTAVAIQYEALDLTVFYPLLDACGARGCVYGLTDPTRNHQIAYVGQTSQILLGRYMQHIQELDGKRAKATWMRGLRGQGLYPGIVILERCVVDTKILLAKEAAWICQLQVSQQAWVNPCTKANPERKRAEAEERQAEHLRAQEAAERERKRKEKNDKIRKGQLVAKARRHAEEERGKVLAKVEGRRARNTKMLGLRAFIPVVIP